MTTIESSFTDIRYLDTLSYRDTFIHRLDPRVKLLTTLLFIVCVISFDKYRISGLMPFFVYPVVLVAVGDIPVSFLLKKIWVAAPFAFFIGIFNPLLDADIRMQIGSWPVSGGWISFISIMIRFVLTVSSALALIATTGFNPVCMAMERLGTPSVFAVQLLFLYRYIFVLTEEASRMASARALRSFQGRGMGLRVFSHMVGQLLLRTLDRAQRIHGAMLSRGFDGQIRVARPFKIRRPDLVFFFTWLSVFLFMRFYPIPEMLSQAVMKWMT